ncbi:SH2/SH3 adapter protein NCK1-like [Oculina patagonica]
MSCNAVALYDYKATDSEELSIKKDEKLVVLDDSKGWWQVENSRKETGYVPSNYVKKSKPAGKGLFKGKGAKSPKENGAMSSPGEYFVPQDVFSAFETVVAKFTFQPQHDDELALKKGDRITVIEKKEDGWWKGKIGRQSGWFPSNYVNVEEENSKPAKSSAPRPVLHKVKTLYNFDPKNPEELSFKKDEILDIIEKPEDDPEWWLARKQDGSTGLVPSNYITNIEDNAVKSPMPSAEPVIDNRVQGKVILPQHKKLSFADEMWFWGKITRNYAEKMLNKAAADGDFLVRVSETQEDGYSVSMKAPDKIKHFRVEFKDGKFKIGPRSFSSVEELIEHYKRSPIFTDKAGNKMFLVKPFEEGS